MIKDELNKLSVSDIYSLILFAIFQLKKDPKYATLSEMIYVVDKESLLNMCKQFGGMTIRIPTLDDLNLMVNALLLYCYVNIEHKSLDEGLSLCCKDEIQKQDIIQVYSTIIDVISDFDFRR